MIKSLYYIVCHVPIRRLLQDHFSRILDEGKGSGATPIAVYFQASPCAGDAIWITLAAKNDMNDLHSIVYSHLPLWLKLSN